MIFCVENETGEDFPFSLEDTGRQVAEAVLPHRGYLRSVRGGKPIISIPKRACFSWGIL